jgi:hypothetical protein
VKPIRRGGLENNISSATVTFSDTGETCILKTRSNSACHFFERFTVGNDDIQLRLDWSDLDHNGYPTLDADFINKKNGKHRSVKGKRHCAHHTASSPGKGRCYEWTFDGFSRQFSIKVAWRASMSESFHVGDFCSAEVISSAGRKLENG